jgi:hypothetical protein
MIDPSLIQAITFFSTLAEKDLQALAEVAQVKDYPSGSTLVESGEESQSLFFLLRGKVRELIRKNPGWPPIVRTWKDGAVSGGCCLLEKTPPSQEIIALTDTKVIEISKKDFLTVVRDHPEILLAIIQECGLVEPFGDERQMPDFDWIQGDVTHFERWIASELESIKLRYEAIEKHANTTMEMVEKHSQDDMEQTEKQLALLISEGKDQLAKNQELADRTIAEVESRTNAALKKVHTFWKIVTGVLSIVIAVTGIGGYFIINKAEKVLKAASNVEEIENLKKRTLADLEKVNNESELAARRVTSLELARTAIQSDIEVSNLWKAVLLFQQIKDKYQEKNLDSLESIKYLTINTVVNRNNLLKVIREYDKQNNIKQPDVLIESINIFLTLTWDSKQKFDLRSSTENRDLIWNCCYKSLESFNEKYSDKQPRDWRFNTKARDNLVLFGKIMRSEDPDYYNKDFIYYLKRDVKDPDLHPYARQAVAQALAMLWVNDEEAREILLEMFNQRENIWTQCIAASCLLRLGHPDAYKFMADLTSQHGWKGLIAAIFTGEVLLEEESKLDLGKLNPKKLFNIIQKRMKEGKGDINHFRTLYAEGIREELKKKYKF